MLSIRALLSLCVDNDLCQLDVKCAFLNGALPQPIYMEIPDGVELELTKMIPNHEYICKLKKALYGVYGEAPNCWYQKLNVYLQELGIKRSQSDQ